MRDTFSVPTPVPHALADGTAPWLAIERLDLYRVALQFLAMVPRLVPARGAADLRDQLERASSSIVLNLGEGAGRVSKSDRARFFARGSTTECAALVDVIRVRGMASPSDCTLARALLVRIVQMLSKLIARQTG
jgi:four helix bundle protein